MSYLDSSEYDDDDHATPGADRTAPRGHRPAWDAATYGHPDESRYPYPQQPPSRGRAVTGAHRYGDGVSAQPLYSDGDFSSTRGSDRDSDAYPSGPDRPEPYPPEPHLREPYPVESYPVERYRPDPYPAERHPAEPYGPEPYGPEPYGEERYGQERYPLETYPVDRYPAGATAADLPGELRPHKSRAGRNLPAAVGVGVLLGGAVLASLLLWRPAFLGVIAVAVGVGIWELVRAIRSTGTNPPLIPLIAGGGLMTGLAWWGAADALTFGLIVTVLAAMVWRLADGAGGYGRDVTAATLIAVYLPFLAGFAALLATPADGDLRVLVTLAGVVLSDTGGYVAGVMFGKHPMAPSVSPKKSWEGLVGSLVATGLGGALLLFFLFDVPLWLGVLFGFAVSAAAVLGDLGESMIKRDLGVKDMSGLLPGHGGLMDRLDSIVFAAPTAYALLIVLAPPL